MKRLLFYIMVLSSILASCNNSIIENSIVPEGAIFASQSISQENPPSGFGAIVIWAQAATLKGGQSQTEKALVTIDYMKTIEEIGTSRTTLNTEEYNYSNKAYSTNEAGLYVRYPKWFDPAAKDYHTQATNMVANNGFLVIDVSQTPDNIIHWWLPRVLIKPGAKYYAEVKLKVEGKCAIQLGSDYWRDLYVGFNVYDPNCISSNNCEAWISNWINDTEGVFKVITVPIR